MILRLVIILILFLPQIQAKPDKQEAMRELKKIEAYKNGAKAMADHLPDLAISRFEETLKSPKLSQNAKSFTTLALAEALIRSSRFSAKPERQTRQALKLLKSQLVKDLPDSPIWLAEALSCLGEYKKSETELSKINKNHPQFAQIQLTRARLLLAINHNAHALKVLNDLSKSTSSATKNSAFLLISEIQLTLSNYTAAQQSLEKIKNESPKAAQLRTYLKAQLALKEKKAKESISLFRSLVNAPNKLNETIYYGCILGLSDALEKSKNNKEAINLLQNHVEENPNSPILQPIFQRLERIIPNNLLEDHPTMLKLKSWSGETPIPENPLYITGETANALSPQLQINKKHDDLAVLALHLRARILMRTLSPENKAKAQQILSRLRLVQPGYKLPPTELYYLTVSKSLLDSAEISLKENKQDYALYTLSALSKVTSSPKIKDRANFLLGTLYMDNEKYANSLAAFNLARQTSSSSISNASSINAGINALLASNMVAFENIMASASGGGIRTSLKLERALWKCKNHDITGRNSLESFIIAHPKHPRENEARLALAAAGVDISPPDILLTKGQLEILYPRLKNPEDQYELTRIHIRTETLAKNWKKAAQITENYILKSPQSPHIPFIRLKQGESYYHNEDFNKAQLIFQKISSQFPQSPFASYADFYTAMAARLGGTSQARENSIELFQKIIDEKQPLANEARIQQGRVLIDLQRYTEAKETLLPLLKRKNSSASLTRDVSVLLADCYQRLASSNPEKFAPKMYQQAIKLYTQELAKENVSLAWRNQLSFLKGQTYQSMNDFEKSLEIYYHVITYSAPTASEKNNELEWFWFYRCGFQALSLLENEKRWEAAVKLARRISDHDGPRAEEAKKRADSLARTHMIWEEKTTSE